MRRFSPISAVLLGVLAASPSMAWNKPGHMVSAAIAYDRLQAEDPEALAAVVKILFEHPGYRPMWRPVLDQVSGDERRGRAMFMLAARWPDDVRGTDEHRGDWHFADYAYRGGRLVTSHIIGGAAFEAYERQVRIVNGDASEAEKAIALCWILHLVGDIHQPLHTVTLVDEPELDGGSDGGGNSIYVGHPYGWTTNAHRYWDGLVFNLPNDMVVELTGDDMGKAAARAASLARRNELARPRLDELGEATTFVEWARDESAVLGADLVYNDPRFRYGFDPDNVTTLSGDYHDEATAAAERRVVLAGHRLAGLLSAWF